MFSIKTSLKLYSYFLFCGVRFSRVVVNAARLWGRREETHGWLLWKGLSDFLPKRLIRDVAEEERNMTRRKMKKRFEIFSCWKFWIYYVFWYVWIGGWMDVIVVFVGFCAKNREMEIDLSETHEPRNRIATNPMKGYSFRQRWRWQWCCTSEWWCLPYYCCRCRAMPCDCSGHGYHSCRRGVKNSMRKPQNYSFSALRTSKLGLLLEG